MSDENASKTQTAYDSDSQSGLNSKEMDRAANLGLLDHFMKIFLYCRRAMVRWSFLFVNVVGINHSPWIWAWKVYCFYLLTICDFSFIFETKFAGFHVSHFWGLPAVVLRTYAFSSCRGGVSNFSHPASIHPELRWPLSLSAQSLLFSCHTWSMSFSGNSRGSTLWSCSLLGYHRPPSSF